MFFKKKKLNETDFSKIFADELLKRVHGLEIISIIGLEVRTKFEDSSDFAHFLNNCYSEYLNDPKSIKEIFDKYLNGAESLYLPNEPVKIEQILPVIKDNRFIYEAKLISPDFESNHIYESYNSELFIFYVQDTEYTINYLTKENFDELNISMQELRVRAIQNLAESLSIEKHGNEGNYMLVAGGSYESSSILLDIWTIENFQVQGNIIIGIPSRDLVVITGSNDTKNLKKLYDLVEKINENGDHIVSNKIFEFKNGKFETI